MLWNALNCAFLSWKSINVLEVSVCICNAHVIYVHSELKVWVHVQVYIFFLLKLTCWLIVCFLIFACFIFFALLHQVHLELLYCPFGTESQFSNPFANQKYSMTSLEKVLKSSTNGADAESIERTANQRKKEVIVRGVLSVTIISGEDLPAMDVMGKADPFVVIRMKKSETKNKTRVTF